MWTTPRTWSTGDKVTSQYMNAIRDNFDFLYDPPTCAAMQTSTQSIPVVTVTAIDLPTTIIDNDGMHGAPDVPSIPEKAQFVTRTRGFYYYCGQIVFESAAAGFRRAIIGEFGNVYTNNGWYGRSQPNNGVEGGIRHSLTPKGIYPGGVDDAHRLCGYASNANDTCEIIGWAQAGIMFAHWMSAL